MIYRWSWLSTYTPLNTVLLPYFNNSLVLSVKNDVKNLHHRLTHLRTLPNSAHLSDRKCTGFESRAPSFDQGYEQAYQRQMLWKP